MSQVISEVKVFVPAPADIKANGGWAFPRLRLVAFLRRFLQSQSALSSTLKLVDEEWPMPESGTRAEYLRKHPGCGVGIMLTLITDDAGIGRIARARNEYESMGFIIHSIDEVGNRGTFACRGEL